MTSRVTTAFSMFQAKSFMKFFETIGQTDSLYAVTADPLPVDGNEENDYVPPNPDINQEVARKSVYENALTAVKIQSSSASRVTRRFNWALGETFVPFSNEINVLEHTDKFYALVESVDPLTGQRKLDVHKCLYTPRDDDGNYLPVGWNNIENGKYRPSGDVSKPFDTTSDFYQWFYMYSIFPYQESAFLTNTFLPIPEVPEDDLTQLVDGTQAYQLRQNVDNAISGAIFNVTVKDGGRDLIDGKYLVEIFNGSTDEQVITAYRGEANIKGGSVTHITLIEAGLGYSGNISVRLPSTASNDISILPDLQADISPGEGHGADPANELGGNFVMINARKYFSEEERGTVTRNDFRTLAIIKNPIDTRTGDIAQDSYYDMTYKMKMTTGVEGITEDSFIIRTQSEPDTGAVKTALVVGVGAEEGEQDGTLLSVIPQGAVYSDGTSDFSKEPAEGESYRLKTGVNQTILASDFLIEYTKPLLRKYSGEILQIEHRKPLNRIEGQIESYSFCFSF